MSWMHRKSYINISQMFVDAFCLVLSYALATLLTEKLFRSVSLTEYLWVPSLFGMVYLFMMYSFEMYHRSTFTYQDRTLRYILKACIVAAVFCLVMMPFASKSNMGIDFLMVFLLASVVIICIQYLIVQELRHSSHSRWKRRAIMVGNRENIQEYLYYIRKTSFHVEAVGYVLLDNKDSNDENRQHELISILRNNVVDEVIFALPCARFESVRPLVSECRDRGLAVRIAMDFMESHDSRSMVHRVGTIPVFTFQTVGLNDFQSFAKRTLDIAGAMTGLVILTVLFPFIAALIKLQIGGPVIIRRPYISLNGRPFTLYWFKTSSGANPPNTFIGRILHRTGMDHLPMFWNVLKGDMSLVGSLPVPAMDLDLLTNHQFRNFCIRPGLTGTWRFADSRKTRDEGYLTELNIQYVQRWSFLLDLWLLIKTVAVVIARKSNLRLLERLDHNQGTEMGYNL